MTEMTQGLQEMLDESYKDRETLQGELAEARRERNAAHAHACEASIEERNVRAERDAAREALGSAANWFVIMRDRCRDRRDTGGAERCDAQAKKIRAALGQPTEKED